MKEKKKSNPDRITQDEADRRNAMPVNFRKLNDAMKDTEINVNFRFLPIEDFSFNMSHLCSNQIAVMFRNGKIEVIPSAINGTDIKAYLGVRFSRVRYWTALPAIGSASHPTRKFTLNPHAEKNDIYAY